MIKLQRALGLNNVGLVVGWSRGSTGYKAVVWENYQSPVVDQGCQTARQYRCGVPGTTALVRWSVPVGSVLVLVETQTLKSVEL